METGEKEIFTVYNKQATRDKCLYIGWPRKNATTLIVNFMNIVDETELFFFYLVEY